MNVIIGAEQKKNKEKVEKVKTKCFVYCNIFCQKPLHYVCHACQENL